MDTGSFTAHVKTKYIYNNISKDVKKRFDTSNYEVDRPLPIRKNKKVNWSGKLLKKFGGLEPKT